MISTDHLFAIICTMARDAAAGGEPRRVIEERDERAIGHVFGSHSRLAS